MDKAVLKRVQALESVRKQGMPDRVRLIMRDGTTRLSGYYEPFFDGTIDNVIDAELIDGFGEGWAVLKALIGGESDE